jgi:hypothetical protein
MTTERGSRGKYAEGEVKKLLDRLNDRADVAWHRMPDSRAARGVIGAQPSDFIVAIAGRVMWWEAKETHHDYRLPRDKVSQLPTLEKFRMAGMEYVVITYHTEDKIWRVMPGKWMGENVAASWDLRPVKTYLKLEAALVGEGVL